MSKGSSALRLEIVEGPQAGTQLDLEGPVIVGRSSARSTFVIQDSEASRRHASLIPQGESINVQDLGSTNGTFVNDERIDERRMVEVGDRLRIGTTVIEVTRGPGSVEPEAEPVAERESVAAEPEPAAVAEEPEPVAEEPEPEPEPVAEEPEPEPVAEEPEEEPEPPPVAEERVDESEPEPAPPLAEERVDEPEPALDEPVAEQPEPEAPVAEEAEPEEPLAEELEAEAEPVAEEPEPEAEPPLAEEPAADEEPAEPEPTIAADGEGVEPQARDGEAAAVAAVTAAVAAGDVAKQLHARLQQSFSEVLHAWSNRDPELMRPHVSQAHYERARQAADELDREFQVNYIQALELRDVAVRRPDAGDFQGGLAEVYVSFVARDWIEDLRTGEVLEGDSQELQAFTERWTFVRQGRRGWVIDFVESMWTGPADGTDPEDWLGLPPGAYSRRSRPTTWRQWDGVMWDAVPAPTG